MMPPRLRYSSARCLGYVRGAAFVPILSSKLTSVNHVTEETNAFEPLFVGRVFCVLGLDVDVEECLEERGDIFQFDVVVNFNHGMNFCNTHGKGAGVICYSRKSGNWEVEDYVLAFLSLSVFAVLVEGQKLVPQPPIGTLPPQSVLVNPQSFAVLGPSGPFRNSSTSQFFNPSPDSPSPPFFQIFDPRFLSILGQTPSFNAISTTPNASLLFYAHEAPVYVKETDELFFVGFDPQRNIVNKLSMAEVESALKRIEGTNKREVNVPATPIALPSSVQQINGGTGPFNSSLLFVTSGFGESNPPSIVLVNPRPPYNATVLLDNFFGRQFNALDDVKIHPTSGAFFFTDVSFAFLLGVRPAPLLPNQVYRFDPSTGEVNVVATDFQKCNGIAFSHDGKTAYVSDTGIFVDTVQNTDQTKPATIYQFDVDPSPGSQTFLNRRVFAYADTGIPDGLQLDASGNLYAGCGDGVNVWSTLDGALLGKFFVGGTVANMAFAGDGRLVLLAGSKVFLARIEAREGRVAFP